MFRLILPLFLSVKNVFKTAAKLSIDGTNCAYLFLSIIPSNTYEEFDLPTATQNKN